MFPITSINWELKEVEGVCQIKGCGQIEPYPMKDIILMQFTGLKDKNGKEVFEGDIVATRDWLSKKLGQPMEIKWCQNRTFVADEYGITITGFYMMGKEDDDFYRSIDEGDEGIEVIGNIFENKELLDL